VKRRPLVTASRPTGKPVSLHGVTKVFAAKDRRVEAVGRLDIEIPPGRFVSLVGPSGCGKTTVLRMIAGLSRPSTGTVRIGGRVVQGPTAQLGMAFQSAALLPWRSALDNVLFPMDILGRRPESRERALDLLRKVGLEGFAERLPRELSGGMQMRVALCRALIHDPELLLLDEPFSGVDELTREGLYQHLLALYEGSHRTVVLVTHGVEEAVFLSDQVIVLSERPAKVVETIEVAAPRPRHSDTRYLPEFVADVRRVREALRL
jgi:NitT/TauT family transport system ATP-binding protein